MSQDLRLKIWSGVLIVGFFVLWEAICWLFNVSDIIVPKPSQVIVTLIQRAPVLWPHTLLGCAALGLLAITQPAAIPYALFLAGGPALAVPLAVMTAWPPLGSLAVRLGIGRLPEETTRPVVLLALALPAIEMTAPVSRPSSV